MKRRVWIIIGLCLAICLAMSTFGGAVLAEETMETAQTEKETAEAEFRVASEEAERQYLNGLFGLPVARVQDVALYNLRATVAGDLLEPGVEKALYNALKTRVAQVAAGSETSTVLVFDNFDAFEFTARDLGLDVDHGESIFDGDNISPKALQRIQEIINPMMDRAISAIFYDCPYETYWRDLYYSRCFSYSWYTSGGKKIEPVIVQELTVTIYVSEDYQDTNADEPECTVNSSRIESVTTAVNNAQAIVRAKAQLPDDDKLRAYAREIHNFTEYDYDAANGGYPYGDPWQLVYVFDEDPDTNVVCEGYSKAFMYLCDESTWQGSVSTICVSGMMYTWKNGTLAGGPHMWNVVSQDGESVLADVTNSDLESITNGGGLFLASYKMKDDQNRTFIYDDNGHDVIYTYDTGTVQTLIESGMLETEGAITVNPLLTLTCDREADEQGIISMPVHDGINFTISADESIRGQIRDARIVINNQQEGLNPSELNNREDTEFHYTPNDDERAENDYTVIAQVLIPVNGENTWVSSKPLTFTAVIDNEITEPVTFSLPGYPDWTAGESITVPQDGILAIDVNNIEAEYYGAFVTQYDETLNTRYLIADTHWVEKEWAPGVTLLHVPMTRCTAGEDYEIQVYAIKIGAQQKFASSSILIHVNAAPQTGDIQISMSDEYVVSAPVCFYAQYTGNAQDLPENNWLRVRVFEAENYNDGNIWDPFDNRYDEGGDPFDFWETNLRIGMRGDYVLEASIWSWNDQGKEYMWSEPVTRTFRMVTTQENQDLAAPEITSQIPSVMSLTEAANFTFDFEVTYPQHITVIVNDRNAEEPIYYAEASFWYEDEETPAQMKQRYNGAWGPGAAGLSFTEGGAGENGTLTCNPGFGNGTACGEYEIEIVSDRWNYQTATMVRSFIIAEGTEQTISLTVNGEEASCEGPAGTPAYLVIEAPGATALRLYNSTGWDKWEFLNDYEGNGYCEKRETIDEGERTYYVEACYEDIDWEHEVNLDALNWTGYSNAVTVRGVFEERTAAPTVTLDGTTAAGADQDPVIIKGKTLGVVIDKPAEAATYGASRFHVTIEDEEGEQYGHWFGEEVTSFPLRVGMSTGWLHTGERYRAVVDAQEIGKGWIGAWSEWFQVSAQGESSDPTIDLDKTPVAEGNTNVYHVLQGEHVQLLGAAPNASYVEIFLHDTTDAGTQYDRQIVRFDYNGGESDDPTEFVFNNYNELFINIDPGRYEVYAVAHYNGTQGETLKTSNRLTAEVEMATRQLSAPQVLIPDGQGGNVTVIAPYDPADQEDNRMLAFTVTGLVQNGANNWEVRVEEERYNDEDRTIYRRTSNGSDGSGTAEFLLDRTLLEEGKFYWIRARVNGIGCYGEEGSVQFAVAAEAADEPAATLSLAGNATVAVQEEFRINVTADSDVTAVLVNRGDRHWELVDIQNGRGRITHRFDETGMRTIWAKYTTYTGPEFPWTQEGFDGNIDWRLCEDIDETWDGWEGMTNALTMTVTSNGHLPTPNVTLSNAADGYSQGDLIKVTINGDPTGEGLTGHEFWYFAEVARGHFNQWGDWEWSEPDHYDRRGQENQIVIPTYRYEPGKYRISVGMGTEGWQDSRKDLYVILGEAAEPVPEFELTVDKTALQTCEETDVIFYAKDAVRVEIEVTKDGDEGWRNTLDNDDPNSPRDTGRWAWSCGEEGTYYFTPVAWYAGEEEPSTGNRVEVNVSAEQGRLNEPVISIPAAITSGSNLTVNVTAVGGTKTDDTEDRTVVADRAYVRLVNVSGPEGWQADEGSIILNANGEGSYTFSADKLKEGMWQIEVNVERTGWNSGYARKRTVVVGETDTTKTVTLTVDGKNNTEMTFPSSQQFHVSVSAPGATAIRVMNGNQWEYLWYENSLETDWGFGDDTVIVAMATYGQLWPGFNPDDVEWTGLSNAISIRITNEGELPVPDNYSLSSNNLQVGEILTVTIDNDDPEGTPEGVDVWYFAELDRKEGEGENTNWHHEPHWNWAWDEDSRTIRINTYNMAEGTYRIRIGIDAVGWQCMQDESQFEMSVYAPEVPATITPGQDVTITLPQMNGATLYDIGIEGPTGGVSYSVSSAQPGNFVIPAIVFADGGGYMINITVFRDNDNPDEDWQYQEMYWNYFEYDVAAYTGTDSLTITAGTFTDSLLPINLSVSDAQQVIVQEKKYADYGQMTIAYWTTVNVTDNPGTTVNVKPLATKEHEFRAAVKRNGVWSAWSDVVEATTPASGQCNENISWVLYDTGKLVISGAGVIPSTYDMNDSWYDFREEITEIEIGSGITGIGNSVFALTSNLTTVTIPATLTSIGENAFDCCGELTTITAANATMKEYKRCYDGAIKTFSLPDTVTEIRYCAFSNTWKFGANERVEASFNIPMGTERIEAYAFYGIKASSVRMRVDNLDSCVIEEKAFGDCTQLRYFLVDSWGENVNYTIDDHAFDGCTNVIFIGEYNEYLRQYAEDHEDQGFMYLENEAVWGNG